MTPRLRTTPPRSARKTLLIIAFVVGALAFGTLVELVLAHAVGATTLATTAPAAASAAPGGSVLAAPSSLDQVIDNVRNLIVGLLVGLATLFLTVGGMRLMLAGGDPGEVEGGKKTLRYAALGYGIAALAPLLVTILKGIVGA